LPWAQNIEVKRKGNPAGMPFNLAFAIYSFTTDNMFSPLNSLRYYVEKGSEVSGQKFPE